MTEDVNVWIAQCGEITFSLIFGGTLSRMERAENKIQRSQRVGRHVAGLAAIFGSVLGSFHSALRTTEDQTERYLAALRNPHIHILGHPRGRIYNFRIGLKADWPRVFAEAAKLDKALEIDCYPDRQDLNVALLKIAREHGTRISLGTDAHHGWQLEFIDLGLAAALRAKISTDRIVNFMSLLELKTWAQALRHGNASKK